MTTTASRGWTVNDWCAQVSVSRPHLYRELKAGRVKAKKKGHYTIIITTPAEYLASLPDYAPREPRAR